MNNHLCHVLTLMIFPSTVWAGSMIGYLAVTQSAVKPNSVDVLSTARPVSIAIPSGRSGYVLQSDGQVISFDLESPANRNLVFELGSQYVVTDLAATNSGGNVLLCVSVLQKVGNTYRGWIVQYLNGRTIWSWLPTSGIYGGVTVHHKNKRVYAVNSSTTEIISVSLEQNDAHYVGSLAGAARPGPLVVNEDGSALIVGDLANGHLYRFDIVTGRSQLITTTFDRGEIRAIARASQAAVFYVADAARETVWYGKIAGGIFATHAPLRSPEFEDPSGIAVDAGGSVWVTDAKARRLFVFGSDHLGVKQVVRW